MPQQHFGELLRAAVGQLQAHGAAEMAVRELALQRLPQVLHLLLVDPHVGIARDAELRIRDHLAAREEIGDVGVDDRRQQDEVVPAAVAVLGHRDDARQDARRTQDGDRGLAAERVRARQLDDEVERLVDDLRKRMRRIEADGRQQRADLAREVAGRPGALRRRPFGAADQAHAGALQRRQHLVVEDPILVGDQRPDFDADLPQQRARFLHRHAETRSVLAQLLLEARNPDLEELVEIAADDAQEAQALEQRNARVGGERQDPPVERERRELTIDGWGMRKHGGVYRNAARCRRRWRPRKPVSLGPAG